MSKKPTKKKYLRPREWMEVYTIRYDIKVGEFWKRNLVVDIEVPEGNTMKNNHDAAEQKFLDLMKGKEVTISVISYN